MIVDVHSHFWKYPGDFSEDFRQQASRAKGGAPVDLTVDYEDYRRHAPDDTVSVVFGGKARLSGLWVDDASVASYVAADPVRLLGFLSVDPTQPDWQAEMEHGHQALGLKGIKLLPMYAGFRPDSPVLDPLWEYATRHRLPVLLHTGTTFVAQAPLECTLPRHLDAVAARFPEVKIIMAHLGHPYEGECIATVRKHPNVYTDISALYYRPFQLYQSLMLVQEYGVWHKVLFGTDYPFTTVNGTVEGLMRLNDMTRGTGLPRLDEDALQAMIHRNALGLLGLRP